MSVQPSNWFSPTPVKSKKVVYEMIEYNKDAATASSIMMKDLFKDAIDANNIDVERDRNNNIVKICESAWNSLFDNIDKDEVEYFSLEMFKQKIDPIAYNNSLITDTFGRLVMTYYNNDFTDDYPLLFKLKGRHLKKIFFKISNTNGTISQTATGMFKGMVSKNDNNNICVTLDQLQNYFYKLYKTEKEYFYGGKTKNNKTKKQKKKRGYKSRKNNRKTKKY